MPMAGPRPWPPRPLARPRPLVRPRPWPSGRPPSEPASEPSGWPRPTGTEDVRSGPFLSVSGMKSAGYSATKGEGVVQ